MEPIKSKLILAENGIIPDIIINGIGFIVETNIDYSKLSTQFQAYQWATSKEKD